MKYIFLIFAIITSVSFIPANNKISGQEAPHKVYILKCSQDSVKILEKEFKRDCGKLDSSIKETVMQTKRIQKQTIALRNISYCQ